MKISVMFSLRLEVNVPRENYSGSLVLWNASGPMTFFFLFLHPFSGEFGELGIYEDENMSVFYGSAIAKGIEFSPELGQSVIVLDFENVGSATKSAMYFLIATILTEVIESSQEDMADLEDSGVDFRSKIPILEYDNRIWQNDFFETPELAENLRRALKLSPGE